MNDLFTPPLAPDLQTLMRGSAGCQLFLTTQVVFGEGPGQAPLFFVGEQPGDQEDRMGKPTVGPARRVLDEALRQAGIARADAYVTNAAKHFKWAPQGKRRLHKHPNRYEIEQCR